MCANHFAPGPSGHALVGGLSAMRQETLSMIQHVWDEYGDLVRFSDNSGILHLLSHPELVQEILVDQKSIFEKLERRPEPPFSRRSMLGKGRMTFADYESYFQCEEVWQSLLQHGRNDVTDLMAEATWSQMLAIRHQHRSGETLDLNDLLRNVTLDVTSRTMFTANLLSEAERIGQAVDKAARFVDARESRPMNLPEWLPGPHFKAFHQALQELDTIIQHLIRERRQAAEPRQSGLVDMLLDACDTETGQHLSDEQVRDEVMMVFAAGHEITADLLSWAFYLLAHHPDVFAALRAEVDNVLGDELPGYDDLQNMPLLRSVIEETMRLHPPVGAFSRLVKQDTTLWGYDILAGSQVIVCVNNVQRHPDFWTSPDTFMPGRFVDVPLEDRFHYAYMPFGAGSHACVGHAYARLEAQVLLASFMQNMTFHPVPGFDASEEATVGASRIGNLPMVLRFREGRCCSGHGIRQTHASR